MAKLPVIFKYGTRADYDSLTRYDEKALYFLTDTGEIYRGDVNLARGSHYEGIRGENEKDNDVIARVLGTKPAVKDDIFVIKTLIADDKYSYASFVYDGSNWAAMDGNYSADNVYFDSDLTVTAPIGVITIPESGSTKIEAVGKNLSSVLASILAAPKAPEVTDPSITVKFTNPTKSLEVGSTITPQYETTFDAGSYSYGPETGITVSSWSVKNSNDIVVEAASGSFPEITVSDDMISKGYSATATANHTAGAMPVNNLGEDAPDSQIAEGSVSATTATKLTGYRNFFYGMLATSSTEEPLTSAVIRTLTKGGNYNGKKTFSMDASKLAGVKRMVIAYPANTTRGGLSSVLLPNSLQYNAFANGDYKKVADVNVEGANGYTAIPYTVYVYEPLSIDATEIHDATLA